MTASQPPADNELRKALAACTVAGHDRDVAVAIHSQAAFRSLTQQQVEHLLAIGFRAGAAAHASQQQAEPGSGRLLDQAVANDLADRELEQLIRQWAEPDAEFGWPGSAEVAGHAEELAAYLSEHGYERPPARSCCSSRQGHRHADGCPALRAALAGES